MRVVPAAAAKKRKLRLPKDALAGAMCIFRASEFKALFLEERRIGLRQVTG
jgi:hypothetical protein